MGRCRVSRDGRWMRPLYVLYGWVPSGFRQRVIRAIKPSFTISAMPVVTNDRDEVLLVRHSYLRDWGLPGGLLNRGEQPAVGAVREGWEEVGLRVELVGEPAVVVWLVPGEVALGVGREGGEFRARQRDRVPLLTRITALRWTELGESASPVARALDGA